ncbi:class I SAM-dependent methyltransferase [Aestuariicoccus sp. MJ-SS9]|uniref:class I SAM-dependent methyltransferase n=1 Tax=Aestuariicoccus sp. MJ-SS9 TaxID=3079855 RepID=UPI002912B424|nr:class I SAM-dependent methyltransferase [Aestuariicoccus sp. MJ-SS9]MDU8909857.1 class I SAM-dependent methyltransferase [Aestuariicoccus sp. MJ-SS9]
MSTSRLSYCLSDGGLSLPGEGRIAVIGPMVDDDLSALPRSRVDIIHTGAAETAFWTAAGYPCQLLPQGPYAAAIVRLPRARELAQGRIAMACAAAPGGLIVVDGAKTDGVESLLKAVRGRVALAGHASKAHGKCFWFAATDAFADWALPGPTRNRDGFFTVPGVFSADGIDPASKALADSLPARLGSTVADFGAGWGYLSQSILAKADPAALHLVENDRTALDCARLNVDDARAAFHWADATQWRPPAPLDCVVMNPPFHTGRKADPSLGRAFILSAARALKPSGQLWLVANRHLPYEPTLNEAFGTLSEAAGDNRFKILHAQRPKRAHR